MGPIHRATTGLGNTGMTRVDPGHPYPCASLNKHREAIDFFSIPSKLILKDL